MPENFEQIMASLDAPMAIVTTSTGDERAGCLVGFHAQSSITPNRCCVWLSKANHTYRLMSRSTHLAVHFLAEGDRELARTFGTLSGDDVDKFELCDNDGAGPHRVPLLSDCPNRVLGRRISMLDEGGDHVCVTLEPVQAWFEGPFVPLRLSHVSDLVPGHDAEERPSPPTERAGS